MKEKIFWGEMNRWELQQRAEDIDTALLPVGSLEQHGPHLPLDTDSHDARYILKNAVQELESPRPPILPTVPYGISDHHMNFPGTVTIGADTLQSLIEDVGRSIIRHGFKKLFIYTGHGGNTSAIKVVSKKLKRETGMLVFVDSGESMEPAREELVESENDVHAGEYETSTALANREELVDERTIPEEEMDYLDEKFEFDHEPDFHFTWDTDELTPTGILGNAQKASKEKGEKLWEAGISRLADRIETVMDMPNHL